MKRPSFQFYPSDWLRDTALKSCSIGARGLWIDMICYMHEGNPYGHLKVNEKVILPANLARMVGITLQEAEGYLDELRLAGVYDIADDGSICSRRMIRDEKLREIRALGGKKGGNPALLDGKKVNLKVISNDNQIPTPSSSSSSSSSNKRKPKNIDKPEGVNQQIWDDFILIRNAKKAPLTQVAWNGIVREANKAGFSVDAALREICERNWTAFKAEWVTKQTIQPTSTAYGDRASV
jgi:hypothetical protein